MPPKNGFDSGSYFRAPIRKAPARNSAGGARPGHFRRSFRFDGDRVRSLKPWPALALRRRLALEIVRLWVRVEQLAARLRPALALARRLAAEKSTALGFAAGACAARLVRRLGPSLPPLFRFIEARSAPVLKFAAVGLAILAAAGLFAQWRHSRAQAERVATSDAVHSAPRRPGWVRIRQPFHLFALPAPFVAGEALEYQARRHATGIGREDFLSYGDFDAKAPFVRLAVTRHGSQKAAAPAFYVEMAQRAAAIGISIDRADAPTPQSTRFGEFEMAAMTMLKGRLARDNCRGFRFGDETSGVAIAGFACGADGQPLSGRELACAINRLDLVSARGDKALRDFFAAAATRGETGCAEPESARRRTK